MTQAVAPQWLNDYDFLGYQNRVSSSSGKVNVTPVYEGSDLHFMWSDAYQKALGTEVYSFPARKGYNTIIVVWLDGPAEWVVYWYEENV